MIEPVISYLYTRNLPINNIYNTNTNVYDLTVDNNLYNIISILINYSIINEDDLYYAIYLFERIIQKNKFFLSHNVVIILYLMSVIISHKFIIDIPYCNIIFSNVSTIDIHIINKLELNYLKDINFGLIINYKKLVRIKKYQITYIHLILIYYPI